MWTIMKSNYFQVILQRLAPQGLYRLPATAKMNFAPYLKSGLRAEGRRMKRLEICGLAFDARTEYIFNWNGAGNRWIRYSPPAAPTAARAPPGINEKGGKRWLAQTKSAT